MTINHRKGCKLSYEKPVFHILPRKQFEFFNIPEA